MNMEWFMVGMVNLFYKVNKGCYNDIFFIFNKNIWIIEKLSISLFYQKGILMEGGNKTYKMVRSGVTVWLIAPSAGPSSSLGISTNLNNKKIVC